MFSDSHLEFIAKEGFGKTIGESRGRVVFDFEGARRGCRRFVNKSEMARAGEGGGLAKERCHRNHENDLEDSGLKARWAHSRARLCSVRMWRAPRIRNTATERRGYRPRRGAHERIKFKGRGSVTARLGAVSPCRCRC